jgi:ferritin-like metal-binding protein YciE
MIPTKLPNVRNVRKILKFFMCSVPPYKFEMKVNRILSTRDLTKQKPRLRAGFKNKIKDTKGRINRENIKEPRL